MPKNKMPDYNCNIYEPAEDSFLLAKHVKKELKSILNANIKKSNKIKMLDMGTGSGIQASACLEAGAAMENILTADISRKAVMLARKKGFHAIASDLFSGIGKKHKFNLIIFNPPYLPVHKYDNKKDTAGGRLGDETLLKFLKQAKNFLEKNGKILIVLSSLTPRKRIRKEIKKQGMKFNIIGNESLFFERLEVWMLERNKNRKTKAAKQKV